MTDKPALPDLQLFLEARLQAAIADANEAGWGTREILQALKTALAKERRAYEADPDPAPDPEPEGDE